MTSLLCNCNHTDLWNGKPYLISSIILNVRFSCQNLVNYSVFLICKYTVEASFVESQVFRLSSYIEISLDMIH